MESLQYEESLETPGIELNPDKNSFKIWGKSFPEEAKKFYEPIINWFDEYKENPNQETIVEFRLDYYNSASATQLLEILYVLEEIHKAGNKAKVIWSYFEEDDDMLEAGREYKEMIEVPVEVVSYVDNK